MEGEEGRREGGSERGMGGGGREGRRDGEREGGKEGKREGGKEGRREGGTEGRRMGTRAKPGNQLAYHILCPLVKPTLAYASASCDIYTTTQTVSLIISKTNRTEKRNIITCKQLCHVHSACSSPDYAMFYYME